MYNWFPVLVLVLIRNSFRFEAGGRRRKRRRTGGTCILSSSALPTRMRLPGHPRGTRCSGAQHLSRGEGDARVAVLARTHSAPQCGFWPRTLHHSGAKDVCCYHCWRLCSAPSRLYTPHGPRVSHGPRERRTTLPRAGSRCCSRSTLAASYHSCLTLGVATRCRPCLALYIATCCRLGSALGGTLCSVPLLPILVARRDRML